MHLAIRILDIIEETVMATSFGGPLPARGPMHVRTMVAG